MRLMKSLSLLAAIFFLSSCANKYRIPDVEPCLELASGGAFCKRFISGTEREETPEVRQHTRVGNVSLSPEDWGALRIYMYASCEFMNTCPKEVVEKVQEIDAAFSLLNP